MHLLYSGIIQALQTKVEEQSVQLRQAHQQLEQEVRQRQLVEESLHQAQQELELRVAQRTAELVVANARLQKEIEQRAKAETELQLNKFCIDRATDAIACLDANGKYVYVNDSACHTLNYGRAQLLSMCLHDINADISTPALWADFWQKLKQQGCLVFESHHRRRDGEAIAVEITANYIEFQGEEFLWLFARNIQERQQAEANLKESEQRLQAIIDNCPSIIYLKDIQGRHILVNSAFENIIRVTREQAKNKTNTEIFSVDTAAALTRNDQNVITTVTPWQFEEQVQLDDGWHIFLTVKFPLCDRFGKPEAICGISTDITERKQAEADLQQSERKLRAIFDSTFEFMGLLSTTGVIIAANRAALDLIAADLADVIGKPFWETPWWKDLPEEQRKLRQAIADAAKGEFVRIETKHMGKDGNIAFVDFSLKPIFDETGTVVMLVPEGRDISDRKLAEQKIQEQAALIDLATDAIFVRDLENRILFWSRGAQRLYGWTDAESLGKKADEFMGNQTPSQLEVALKTVIQQGYWQGELEQTTKTGQEIIVASRWTLVHNQFGQAQSILVVNTNITEKKLLEQQFYRAQRLESIGTLASGIAHDLNNVFAPIVMIAQLLALRHKNLDAQTQELLTTLETTSKRGADLVKQILTFARGKEGKRILLQPGYLLQELVKVIKQTFPKSIELNTEIPTKTLGMVEADPSQLDQVFMNLAVNARDAMPHGGMLTITAENRMVDDTYARMYLEAQAGNYVVVTFSDTGTGIPPEILERIFDPFFTTKEVGKGTGLGLSTVLGIVKNHGGFVQVVSQVGHGTQFQVFLPRGEGVATEATIETQLPRGEGELILVVDDEAVVQQSTQKILTDYNYKTLVAKDGIEAIALYLEYQTKISIVLLDILMPNMDGLTAIRTLQKLNPNVKIIATSGLLAHKSTAIAIGAQKFLSKPYTAHDLLTTLSALIPH